MNKVNKQSDFKGQHSFILFYLYVADPATFLASNSGLGSLFSSENSVFIQLWKKLIFILFNLNFFSNYIAPL